jgi:hypothetical protein
MSDDFEMRLRLQKVAAYRELCRGVRRSGRENVVFATIMLFLAYLVYENGFAPPLVITIYVVLAGGELLVGLFKWLAASAEGILLDGLVLLVFASFNLYIAYDCFQNNRPINPVIIFLSLFMLMGALKQFRTYTQLRYLFADRPSAEHMAWVDDLVREILSAEPQSDELVLDLPTGPHWKAKLLGKTVFFVARRGGAIWIAGPDDFELLREKTDHGTGKRKALLKIHGVPYPDFEITDASWSNYQKWRIANPLPVIAPAPTS